MSGMHLVRGMTTISTRKRKSKKKTAAVLEEEKKMSALLQRVGYQKGATHRVSIPNYRVSEPIAPTSDMVGNGYAKPVKQYTGDELAGIGTLHKSNMVPIRKDSNAAKEIATMRRN